MKTHKGWIVSGTIVLAALVILALAVTLTQAQGSRGEGVELSEEDAAAPVGSRIPVQGRLTDDSGNPLDGSVEVTFRLYGVLTGGTPICSDTQSVNVNQGLFNANIGGDCEAAPIDGRQLYLGIEVEGDGEMTPRQPIFPVPYAWSLRPGAIVSDTSDSAILRVRNRGSGTGLDVSSTNGSAVNASSVSTDTAAVSGFSSLGYGVRGTSVASAGVYAGSLAGPGLEAKGGFGADIRASGSGIIQSTANSYVWISGNNLVKANSADTTTFSRDLYGGFVIRGGTGWATPKVVVLPITIVGPLYGQDVTVTYVRLYYTVSADLTAIITTNMRRQSGVGAGDSVFADTTDLTCTPGAQCTKEWELTQNNVLSAQHGIFYLAFELGFADSAANVQIGGVRLTLAHE